LDSALATAALPVRIVAAKTAKPICFTNIIAPAFFSWVNVRPGVVPSHATPVVVMLHGNKAVAPHVFGSRRFICAENAAGQPNLSLHAPNKEHPNHQERILMMRSVRVAI
jgi:hypothetical protein